MDCGTENSSQNETEGNITAQSKQKKQKKSAKTETNKESTAEVVAQKSYRKRKRHHYNAIRTQMEFYFGDANLLKDRFLKQLIDKDPYVPLDVFLTFNKVKALTTSVGEIAKSLSNSTLLELDDSQQKVRRKTALPTERNVDEKTLYVEALPQAADHDWVRNVFERFGAVTYVSLPKYSKSRKIKEFGFVEFEQESSVAKAIKAFHEFKGVLQMQEADPAELQSVKAFIKEQNQSETSEGEDRKQTDKKNNKKRKKNNKSDEPVEQSHSEDGEPKAKKSKSEVSAEEGQSTASETAGETTNDELDGTAKESDDGVHKKKRRKKKKKSKNSDKRRKDSDLNADATFYELKILPKRDWKRLRNKYLNLQREKIAELKRQAWKEQQQALHHSKENTADAADAASGPPAAKKSKPNERKLQRMNMNFYGAGEEENKTHAKEVKHNPALERTPLFTYSEGLIVEVSFMEPCVNVKEFKADMRQYDTVKYVDVKEGSTHANLRLENASAAEELVRRVSCAEYKCKILSGESEAEYWKKIEKDREMKLNKQVKVPQKRGREKVKKLLMKHIRFGDDDAEE